MQEREPSGYFRWRGEGETQATAKRRMAKVERDRKALQKNSDIKISNAEVIRQAIDTYQPSNK